MQEMFRGKSLTQFLDASFNHISPQLVEKMAAVEVVQG
jgi:hypothetical protein